MKSLEPILSDTRLRLSYGANGTLPYGYYDHLSLYSFGYNYNGGTGASESDLGSPNLSWERTRLSTSVLTSASSIVSVLPSTTTTV